MQKRIKIADSIYQVSSDDEYLVGMGNTFEPHMVQLFRALVGPSDVVADVGANIGMTALLFSKLAKKTYAFEPSPSTYRILSENLSSNGVDNVEPINIGFGENKETLWITFAKNNRSGGYVSDKIRPESGHVTEEIHIETLDQFFAGRNPSPTFLKIDVEGFEMNVVKGASTFLATHRPVVVMEMNHFCLDVLQRITIPDFLDFMRSVFPLLYAVDADNCTIVDLHIADKAYAVMHDHVVKQRFPNLVGAFDMSIKKRLDELADSAKQLALRHSNTKTPAILKPTGKVELIGATHQLVVGGTSEIKVQVTNAGDETWCAYGDHPVRLSYHWKTLDGGIHVYDGLRTDLINSEIEPGLTFEQHMNIMAPVEKGVYRLMITIVQEGECWFEERGFCCVEFECNVI